MTTIRTTSLLITRPDTYERLAQAFTLVRYEIPRTSLWWSYKAEYYKRLHSGLREQLDYPYKTFAHDTLDGAEKTVVYVLLPVGASIPSLTIAFPDPTTLAARIITFAQITFFNIVKLLQISYFRGKAHDYFIGRDECYVYAKADPRHHRDLCLKVSLEGDRANDDTTSVQLFHVRGEAKGFRRVAPEVLAARTPWKHAYFMRRVAQEQPFFVQVKTSVAQQLTEPLYEISTTQHDPALLTYHDLDDLETSTGTILFTFIQGLRAYLRQYDLVATPRTRTMTEFPVGEMAPLPLDRLGPVSVYDNRQGSGPPIEEYLALLAHLFPQVSFRAIGKTLPAPETTTPLLVLQDYRASDFGEGGFFTGQADPYQQLYARLPQTPKQSINVNGNDPMKKKEGTLVFTPESYRCYDLPQEADKRFPELATRLTVAMNELFLKDVVRNGHPIRDRLPPVDDDLLFLRKQTVQGQPQETLLAFVGGRAQCYDIATDEGWAVCEQLLADRHLDWDTIDEWLIERHAPRGRDNTIPEVKRYDLVLATDACAEILPLPERISYEYDLILARHKAQREEQPITDFVMEYDAVRPGTLLPAVRVQPLVDGTAVPQNEREQKSLTLYQQVQAFNAVLMEIAQTRMRVSFVQLTQDPLLGRLAQHLPGMEKDRIRRWLLKRYEQRDYLLSPKASALYQGYQGIWFGADASYVVGSPTPFKFKQPRAYLLRHLEFLLGTKPLALERLLPLLAVPFVRHNQYTVVPFPFHLIDLFVALQHPYVTTVEEEEAP